MAFITIGRCTYNQSNYSVLVVLMDTYLVEGEERPSPLGEATVRFPSHTPDDEIKKKIVKAAEAIWKAYSDQTNKKADIEQMDFPPIP